MNLEEIKKKKLEELQSKINQPQNQAELEKQQLDQLKKKLLNKHLTKEAIERLGRVRLAHPSLAEQAELVILQATQTGKIDLIGDKELKEILTELSSGKKEFRFIK